MSDQFKLSKLFYINPTLLPQHRSIETYYASPPLTSPLPYPYPPTPDPLWAILKNSIFTNGFDSKYPIIVRLEFDSIKQSNLKKTLKKKYIKIKKLIIKKLQIKVNKMLLEFPRFPSATSIKLILDMEAVDGFIDRLGVIPWIADGSHRLAVALELKLDYVPVRFEYKVDI